MNKFSIITLLMLAIAIASCNSGDKRRNPGKAYAMDMTYSRAYDYYNMYDPATGEMGNPARLPVQGTVARGHELPDHLTIADTVAFNRTNSGKKFTDAEIQEGGRLYNIYCGVCHGPKMDGQGPLYTSGKFASMPANLVDPKYVRIAEGQIYSAIKFGKNTMGSYASQLDIKQRWMIIAYIKQNQSKNGGDPFMMGSETAVTATKADSSGRPGGMQDTTGRAPQGK